MDGAHVFRTVPVDGALAQEKMRAASSSTPNRWGERRQTIAVKTEGPGGIIAEQQTDVDCLTAAARTEKRGRPRLGRPDYIQMPTLEHIWKVIDGNASDSVAVNPRVQRFAHCIPCYLNNPVHESAGLSSRGVMSPRPTCRSSRAHGAPSASG